MNSQVQPILLVGFTARMLAELAVQAGYSVLALDYFGDADLQVLCPSRSLLRDYPEQDYSPAALVEVAGELAAPAVMYTASFENHPAEVARLAQGRELLGNTPTMLAQVREPVCLASVLRTGGFLFPKTFSTDPNVAFETKQQWLWKPLHSGGGHGVRLWRGGPLPAEGMLQERLTGLVGSMAFVANGRQAVVLGLTEQLVGRQTFGATGFRYCGNLLPPRLKPDELKMLLHEARALAVHLTKAFGLRGLNGVDFIWHKGRLWTIEVNPRPSASLELVDLTYGLYVFDAHVRAFSGQLPDFDLEPVLTNGRAAGKAILYASQDVTVGDTGDWAAHGIRDIPHPDERIRQRHPICTILITGPTPNICLRRLQTQAAKVKTWLTPIPCPI